MRDLSHLDTTASSDSSGADLLPGGLFVPHWINSRLFPYQRTGLRWMWELRRQGAGGVVGDEMGLGKTVQVASYLGCLASSRRAGKVLIICPATMMSHWLSEMAAWAPGLRRVLIHRSAEASSSMGGANGSPYGKSLGQDRSVSAGLLRSLDRWLKRARADRVNEAIDDSDYDDLPEHSFCGTGYALITTYDNVRRSADVWTGHRWDCVVLDEGQRIRNPDADVTLTCKRFLTPHRLLLSGTPIQNDLRELWSLFDFVFPGRLGTLPAFEVSNALLTCTTPNTVYLLMMDYLGSGINQTVTFYYIYLLLMVQSPLPPPRPNSPTPSSAEGTPTQGPCRFSSRTAVLWCSGILLTRTCSAGGRGILGR